MSSVTPFQQKVYDACARVPRGRVATYAEMARAVGCPSPRAVGQALKQNPFAPRVPCHRVIASDRRLGGFAGQGSGPEVERKRSLLEAEGVGFAPDGRVKPQFIWEFSLAKPGQSS